MVRFTKRTKKGKASFDVWGPYAERLAEYEDTGLDPLEIIMMQNCWDRYKDSHTCNNCGCENCSFKPDWGDPVVINCPLWIEGKDDE